MKIEKKLNDYGSYNIKLTDNEKDLIIMLGGNGDLYMSITNGERLNEYANDCRFIDINKSDEDIYSIFDNLHNEIVMKSDIIDTKLVDKDKNVIWVSDEGIEEVEDSVMIFKNDNYYRLIFFRNNIHEEECPRHKSSRRIDIRFSNSGSRYKEFVSCFMNLYQNLKNLDEPKIYKK